eukprot:gene409-biopygen13645
MPILCSEKLGPCPSWEKRQRTRAGRAPDARQKNFVLKVVQCRLCWKTQWSQYMSSPPTPRRVPCDVYTIR